MNAKIRFRRKFPSKCNKPIVKWYKPHGAIHFFFMCYANFAIIMPWLARFLRHIYLGRKCAGKSYQMPVAIYRFLRNIRFAAEFFLQTEKFPLPMEKQLYRA